MRLPSASLRLTLTAAGVLLALLVVVFAASTASAATRATLTWDTDDTDVDLHIWDEFGNHAYWLDQTAVDSGRLSTDILYGFGPEHFEEFVGEEGRTYTYGVCYYGSNRTDGVVPDTVATVELTDPDGSRRTLRRVLRQRKDAYYLGASPAGASDRYLPDDDWCAEGPYHPESDSGPDPASTGGGGGSFEGCSRIRRRIGVVEICADSLSGSGTSYVARGNVRVNGSIVLGEGPFTLDTRNDRVSGMTPLVTVVNGGRSLPIAGGHVVLQTDAVADPLSGRTGLARLELGEPIAAEADALRAAGIPVSLSALTDDALSLYVDARDGGGVIAAARLKLPFAGGRLSAEELAVGIHGRSAAAVRVLAGSASFDGISLPGGWSLGALRLTYNEAGNRWEASGSLGTPWLGLDIAGGLADGQLDSLDLGLSREVQLGTSGFVLSKAGGSVSGIAVPPLKVSARVAGRWGSVRGLRAALIHFENVTLTLDFSGGVRLKGAVDILSRDSPIGGTLDLSLRFVPSFKATGKLTTHAKVAALNVRSEASMAMTTSAFTARGNAQGELRGLRLGAARGVVSDKGMGASGEVRICILRACVSESLGFGMDWRDFPNVRWIGGDVDQFVTVSAQRRTRTIVVEPGRPLLFVDMQGAPGTRPAFTVVGPGGRRWTSARRRPDSTVVVDKTIGFVGLTILRPRPGRYVVRPDAGMGRARLRAQTIRRVTRVRALRLPPAGSRRKPLRRRGAPMRVRWTSRGLPRTTRVAVQLVGRRGVIRTVASGKRARGSVTISRRRLARGANRFRLVVSDRGVPVYDLPVPGVIWAR